MTQEEIGNMSEEQRIAYIKSLNPYVDMVQIQGSAVLSSVTTLEELIEFYKNCVVLIKSGDVNGNYGYAHKEFMIIHPELLKYIIRDGLAPGSIAYTAALTNMYQLGPDNSWYKIGAGEVGGDDQVEPK